METYSIPVTKPCRTELWLVYGLVVTARCCDESYVVVVVVCAERVHRARCSELCICLQVQYSYDVAGWITISARLARNICRNYFICLCAPTKNTPKIVFRQKQKMLWTRNCTKPEIELCYFCSIQARFFSSSLFSAFNILYYTEICIGIYS